MFKVDFQSAVNAASAVLISIWLCGCADAPVADNSPAEAKAEPTISVDRQLDEKLALTGNTVYVYPVPEALNKILSREHQAEVSKLIKNYLKDHGFSISEKYSKGYSTVYISGDEYKPGVAMDPEAQKFLSEAGYPDFGSGGVVTQTTETTKIVDGKVVTKKTVTTGTTNHRLAVQWDINQYARRPKKWFNLTFATEASLDKVWPDLMKSIRENLDKMKIAPTAEPIKMGGDPGCLPRFGFDESRVLDGIREIFKVTKVLPHSPAQKAGLRVGDLIEAIDSVPYGSDWHAKEPTDAYEKKVAVPIKFSRNGETIRSTIRAEVMCND